MTENAQRLLKRGAIVVLLALLAYTLFAQAPGQGPRRDGFRGGPAPDFALQAVDGSRDWTLAQVRGRGALLVFWATHCRSCKQVLPLVERLRREVPEHELAILTVTSEEPGVVATYLARHPTGLTATIDAGSTHAAFRVDTLPSLVFLAPDGTVTFDYVGPIPWTDLKREADRARAPVGPQSATRPGRG